MRDRTSAANGEHAAALSSRWQTGRLFVSGPGHAMPSLRLGVGLKEGQIDHQGRTS
jgi:hypothetical protein